MRPLTDPPLAEPAVTGEPDQPAPVLTATVHPHVITAGCPARMPGRATARPDRQRADPRTGPRSRAQGTVADVLRLHRQQRLSQIRNLGAKGIAEIEAVLTAAGLTGQRGAAPGTDRP